MLDGVLNVTQVSTLSTHLAELLVHVFKIVLMVLMENQLQEHVQPVKLIVKIVLLQLTVYHVCHLTYFINPHQLVSQFVQLATMQMI
jgi:hypothetical protein